MKTVAKINPEKEYELAKKMIEVASQQKLDSDSYQNLNVSVDNIMSAARILMEREELRRINQSKFNKPKQESRTDKNLRLKKEREEFSKLPSEKYPLLEVKEEIKEQETLPTCPCCQNMMKPSGLFDTSEKVHVIPKKYYIIRSKRVKYNCSHCYGAMVNTLAEPSISPTSCYSDSIMIDVACSKYNDLIPIERYAQIAHQCGVIDLPPNSLISLTHYLSDFLLPVFMMIKDEVLSSPIIQADETVHRMLEGDETMNWRLWGFLNNYSCYFEINNTRSGDIALNFLKDSEVKYLVTDGYSGYKKCIKELKEKYSKNVDEVFCNSHAYRYFKEASVTWKEECEVIIKLYKEIYKLESSRKEESHLFSAFEQLSFRSKMIPLFEEIKKICLEQKDKVMPGSQLFKAMGYFINHYDGLIKCTTNIDLPLDNNLSERELRAPVIGRKTWLGTHSKRGAETNAVLFSIIQTCKLNNIN